MGQGANSKRIPGEDKNYVLMGQGGRNGER